MDSFVEFMEMLAPVVDEYHLHCVVTASMPAEELPRQLGKYIGNE